MVKTTIGIKGFHYTLYVYKQRVCFTDIFLVDRSHGFRQISWFSPFTSAFSSVFPFSSFLSFFSFLIFSTEVACPLNFPFCHFIYLVLWKDFPALLGCPLLESFGGVTVCVSHALLRVVVPEGRGLFGAMIVFPGKYPITYYFGRHWTILFLVSLELAGLDQPGGSRGLFMAMDFLRTQPAKAFPSELSAAAFLPCFPLPSRLIPPHRSASLVTFSIQQIVFSHWPLILSFISTLTPKLSVILRPLTIFTLSL